MMAVNFSDFIGLVYVGRLEMSRYSIYSTGSKCENDKTWEIIQRNPGERERDARFTSKIGIVKSGWAI